VTHRLATAARADLVAWIDGGRVRAIGPHAELWADPAYRAIHHAPAGDDPETVADRSGAAPRWLGRDPDHRAPLAAGPATGRWPEDPTPVGAGRSTGGTP
jgi:ATP-binding cassette subfamily B protein